MVQIKDKNTLSAREAEVWRYLANGWTNESISKELSITPKTVSRHIESVYPLSRDFPKVYVTVKKYKVTPHKFLSKQYQEIIISNCLKEAPCT